MRNLPIRHLKKHIRNVPMDIILTLVTGGLYNFWIQHKQMKAVNDMLGERKYSFLSWSILTLLTFGLYHVYHEYKKSIDINEHVDFQDTLSPILVVILTISGLWIVADTIQQTELNEYFEKRVKQEKTRLLKAAADDVSRSELYAKS